MQLPINVNWTNLPAESRITESGKPLRDVPDIKILDRGEHWLKVEVGAGRYHFEVPWK